MARSTRLICCRQTGIAAVTLICALAVGCGSKVEERTTGTLSGKVTFESKPLTKAMINLIDGKTGAAASVELGEDGSYQLEALQAGSFKVYFTQLPESPPDPNNPSPPPQPLSIPQKFRSESTTDLTVEIKAGNNEKNFEL